MAVLQMQRISIYGLKKNRKQVLEILQRCGAVETDDALPEDNVFQKTDITSQKSLFEKNKTAAQQALEVLDRFAPVKKSAFEALNGRKEISDADYNRFCAQNEKIQQTVLRLNALSKDIAECRGMVQKLQTQIEAFVPWLSLDISMRMQGTKSTAVFVGTLVGGLNEISIEELLANAAPGINIHAEVISSSQEQTCVFILCGKADAKAVEDALRSLGFARPTDSSKISPSERTKELQARLKETNQTEEKARQEIESYSEERQSIQFMVDYLTMRLEKYEVLGRLIQSRHTFILTGYVPKRDVEKVSKELAKFDVAVELEDPAPEEDVPVLLQNNKFAEPMEGVLESFSLPGKTEVDPSFVMAVFYYFLFGMMLSDAAYGLIMVIGCGLALSKFKNMEHGMKKTMRMFLFCGISTTLWGFLFGSFFGDAVKVISTTFFGKTIVLAPLWFEPINEPMHMLMFALLVGIIHLFTGLGVQFYQLVRQKKYLDALYDVIFWYMLVGGLTVLLLSTKMFADIAQLSFILPASVGNIAAIVAGVAAAGIILTGGRDSRNPFKRILKGLYSLYNVTGYLSDVLSYSRLLALGLATSVIATVINKMGSMGGGGITGAILFILVFILGHSINIGINLLGAYVHTNRLQFVEFFGKFYEGGGKIFNPFGVHTKYYKFKEE